MLGQARKWKTGEVFGVGSASQTIYPSGPIDIQSSQPLQLSPDYDATIQRWFAEIEERQATLNNWLIERMRRGNTQNVIETYNNLMTQLAQNREYFMGFIQSHLNFVSTPSFPSS